MKTKYISPNNIKLSILFASCVLLAACSKDTGSKTPGEDGLIEPQIAGNIIGGRKSQDSFQKENGLVALLILSEGPTTDDKDDKIGICTGTLISKKIVLTAAHCIDSEDSQIKNVVIVFTQDVAKAIQKDIRTGVKGLPHEHYSKISEANGTTNDIALIKLNEDAPDDFKFAQLPALASRSITNKTQVLLAGFGRTDKPAKADKKKDIKSSADTTGTLLQVESIEVLGLVNNYTEILLKQDGKGACNGDSGGPAFTKSSDGKLTQVGITSRGTEDCMGASIYTHVAAHLDWIKRNTDLLMTAE